MKKSATSLRPFQFRKSYLPHTAGSCLVSMGLTQVLCVASVENKVPPHAEEKGTGWIHAEYAMLPHAGHSRSSRSKTTSGGRVQEISRLVGRSLRAAVHLTQLAPYTIVVDCDVIRADGGTRTAAINGGFLALALALKSMCKQGQITTWPLKHFVGAVSVGVIKGKPILDICYEEDKDAGADLNVVMTDRGDLIEIQGTAEGNPFSMAELTQMVALSRRGIKQITAVQKKILGPCPS